MDKVECRIVVGGGNKCCDVGRVVVWYIGGD